MDWAQAMYGATYGILATHDEGKCPSVTQRAIRLTVARLYNEQHRRQHGFDSRLRDPSVLKLAGLYLEYKRKD